LKLSDAQSKQVLLARLRRIEGQARGIQAMVEEERDCHEIMQQFASIRSSLQSCSALFLKEYATQCLSEIDLDNEHQRSEIIEELLSLAKKT